MSPVIFNIGQYSIHAYSLCMAAAILLGAGLTYREAVRRGRFSTETLLVGAVGLAGGVFGAKAGMIIFLGPAEFARNITTLPFHGSTITGALIGGYLAVVLYEKLLGVDRCLGDVAAPFIPLAQAFGRLGNFLAVDAYGTATGLPWGVNQAGAQRHPVQLYEMGLDLALFVYLLRRRRMSFKDGELWKIYIVGYALIRFPLEFMRFQPTPIGALGLTLVQWLCIATVAWFAVQTWSNRRRATRFSSRAISDSIVLREGKSDAAL